MQNPIAAVVEGGIRGLCQGVPNAIGVFQRNRAVNQIIDRAGQAGVPLAEDGIRGAGRLVDDGLRNAGELVNHGARRVGSVAEDGIRNVGDAADQWNRTVQAGTVEAAREARDSYRDVKREVGEWNHLLRKFTVLTGRNLLVWISVCGVGAVGAVWQRVFCTPDNQTWLCTTASIGSMVVFASIGCLAYQILHINVQKIREMKDKPDDLSQRDFQLIDPEMTSTSGRLMLQQVFSPHPDSASASNSVETVQGVVGDLPGIVVPSDVEIVSSPAVISEDPIRCLFGKIDANRERRKILREESLKALNHI